MKQHHLGEATCLVEPGHPRAIPELVEHPDLAAEVIDIAMRGTTWLPNAGTGTNISQRAKWPSEEGHFVVRVNLLVALFESVRQRIRSFTPRAS